ncbi:MAG: SoxR reducing system RseC family protein [Pseudomonadota bacterium]
MIRSEVTLTQLHNDYAVVEFSGSVCAPCREGKGCGAGLLGSARHVRVDRNQLPENATIGSTIVLECEPKSVLHAAMIGYGLPLAGMILGSSIAARFAASEWVVVLAAASGVAAGLAFARRLASRRTMPRVATE